MPGFVPNTIAPTHPGRFRSDAAARGVAGLGDQPGATVLGGPFLPDTFTGGGQSLEAAFGADLSADPATWTFTDVTPYVRWNPGIATQIGSTGTAAKRIVASQLTAILDNDQDGGGDWTIGNATGRFGSQLRENTPIRGRLDIGAGANDRFCGFLTSIPPTRGAAGDNSVALTAHGASKRIAKGRSKPFSALRKSYDRAFPDAYWPLERGTGGTVGASAVAGVPDMTVTMGSVSFGTADDSLPSSLPLAQFSREGVGGQLTGTIPPLFRTAIIGGTVDWSREFSIRQPALSPGASISVMNWYVRGTIDLWNVTVKPVADGGLVLGFINTSGGVQSYLSNVAVDDGEWHHVRVDCQQTAGVAVQVTLDGVQILSQSTTGTNGFVTTVIFNPDATADDSFPSLGHDATWNGDRPNDEDTYAAFLGHTGDTVAERMIRLAMEASVQLDIIGVADDVMGPQRAGAFLDLLQDAVDVDAGGLLCDGITFGLTYYTRQSAYSIDPCLTLDSADGDYLIPLPATHSDQGRVNRYTATDPLTNADRTFEQTDGPMGSDAVGLYEEGDSFRVNIINELDQIAAWMVGQGTVPGLRWPSLPFELAKPATSVKAADWLATRPLCRVDALGITTGSRPDRSLILRGWVERWNSRRWTVALAVGPYDGYAVTVLAADTGAVGEFTGWYEVDDDVVTAALLPAGGTSVTVNLSTTGTVLTNPSVGTYTDDLLGLYVDLDGLKVGVTAITAPAGGQQTLTVAGSDVVRAVPAGTPLLAWAPFKSGL